MRNQNVENRRKGRRWTESEEQRIIRHVKARPQNLHRCFMMVAEELDRSVSSVQAHWYTKTSKRPDAMCFFTASPKHVSKNRKNGMGEESNNNIWRRLLNIIRNIGS